MFISSQRVSTSNISSIALRQLFVNEDDKIRINKFNVYYEDRIGSKN